VSDPDHPYAYDVGECAHCHDTFNESICGSNDLMLFTTQYFCVQCHQYPTNSFQEDMPYQGLYSRKFGGDTTITCPSSVKSAFMFINQTTGQPMSNCDSENGSAHYLADIADFLQNKWGFGDAADIIDPCEGCHNPHKAQRHDYPAGSQGTSPISLPSTHAGNWDVYGAKTTERMDKYTIYQAPYAVSGYEPDGSTTVDGSNLPDYVTFCTDCHNTTYTIYSNALGRDLIQIDWTFEKHGLGDASDDYDTVTERKEPYADQIRYVLACTDCHEPHGSPNIFLTRQRVNNGNVTVLTGTGVGPYGRNLLEWIYLCDRCHEGLDATDTGPNHPHPFDYDDDPDYDCFECHNGGGINRSCGECHFHGNTNVLGFEYGEPLF
jgi:hypothetical protein